MFVPPSYAHSEPGRSFLTPPDEPGIRLRVLSLGAGVQSTTLGLMAAQGEIGPMPDCAVFADTGWEPKAVYEHLDWLRSPNVLPFPVHMVSAGNIRDDLVAGAKGHRWASIPAFTRTVTPAGTELPIYDEDENGDLTVVGTRVVSTERVGVGMIRRQCTGDYKIVPIRRKVRELLGIAGKRSPKTPIAEQWIGISLDEAIRMKPSFEDWQITRWPLIEKQFTRQDCLRWLERRGYPLESAGRARLVDRHLQSARRRQPGHDDALRLGPRCLPVPRRRFESIEAGRLPDGSPDLFFRGFYAWNSEVGAKTLGIASFYLRAVCQNRNLWGVEQFEEITIRHSKYAASRFAAEAAPALTAFADSSPAAFVAGIRAARERIVARTDEDRSDFLRRRGFSKTDTGKIIETVLAEEGHPPASIFDFVQGITEHTLHVVSGLLLPVWKRLPDESTRVYRLQTDDGERIIGRRVSPAWAADAASTGAPALTPDQALAALLEGRTVLDLIEGLQLRRVRVMAEHRIELTGFTEAMRDRLRAYGLFTEIISWKLRFFVPVDGPTVLGRLLDTYAIARVSDRAAA